MKIKSLEVDFFRNYRHAEINFSPGVNLFFGENAQGKTNLLEAVSYLALGRSYRTHRDSELISFGVDWGFIKGEIAAFDRNITLEVKLRRGARRQILRNGSRLPSGAALGETLRCVLFCPEDLTLIRAGAAERRRFTDDALCQMRPAYASALAEYRRLYEQKTRILRDWHEKPSLLEPLDDFNLRLAQVGAVLILQRARFIEKLAPYADAVQREFSGKKERLSIRYQTVKEVLSPETAERGEVLEALLAQQQRLRGAEIDAGLCLAGPHKDDFLVTVSGEDARLFASQGQVRTATLSLKLAERRLFYEDSGSWPVLLLDDVLSELDEERQNFVLGHIKDGQVFITCTEEKIPIEGKRFSVKAGAVKEM